MGRTGWAELEGIRKEDLTNGFGRVVGKLVVMVKEGATIQIDTTYWDIPSVDHFYDIVTELHQHSKF